MEMLPRIISHMFNDYRNGVVAEGMKVLGFVNRYRRGVQAVQDELKANSNGEAEFILNLGGGCILVIEHLSAHAIKGEKKEMKKELKEVLNLIGQHPNMIRDTREDRGECQ